MATEEAPLKKQKAPSLELHDDLKEKLAKYRETRGFDADKWIEAKCTKFNKYLTDSGLKAAVVSLSGGVDSAVTLALMKHASKMEGSPLARVAGIAQPIHSSAWALERATEAAKSLDAELFTVDQTEFHSQLAGLVESAVGITGESFQRGQLRSYMRTPVGYYVAQLLSQAGTPCVVMGTGNQDEDGFLMYFCKAGDGVCDLQLISDLHKSEVFTVGARLGVPASILSAPPSADLWDGQTDEEELGVSYDGVELLTGGYISLNDADKAAYRESLSSEALAQLDRMLETIMTVHRRNKHKADCPLNL